MMRHAAAITLCALLAIGQAPAGEGTAANAQKPQADQDKPSQLAKDLIGTWALAGTPDNVVEPPADGGRLKLIAGGHWSVTQYDPQTGKVIYHHGGTYTIDGDTYAETVKYATESTAELVGQTFKFKVKVEGDKYTQIGVGNDFNEVWKRAK